MAKPTIIFCSGAWHTGFHIQPVIPHFEKAGHQIIPCPLPSAGKKVDADAVITTIKDTVLSALEQNLSIAIILHSAAGLLGIETINRAIASPSDVDVAQRINIIFLGSMLTWGPIVQHLLSNNFVETVEDGEATRALGPSQSFFNDMDPAEAKPFVDELVVQYNAPEPEISSEAWRGCGLTHLCCTKDQANPVEWQVRMAEEWGMRAAKMDAGHDPFVSVPGEFVDVVDGILK